jgi:hypothetical protein
MDADPPEPVRETAREHVLSVVHPDRLTAEVVTAAPGDAGWRVGVKAAPRGYLSVARYAVVTLDGDAAVVAADACTRPEMRAALER